MNVCLDTSFLVDLLRGDAGVRRRFVELRATGNVGATPISLGSLYHGARRMSGREWKKVQALEGILQFLPLRPRAARIFGMIAASLEARGLPIQAEDTFIAAIALDLGLPVVTRNTRHFGRIPGLATIAY